MRLLWVAQAAEGCCGAAHHAPGTRARRSSCPARCARARRRPCCRRHHSNRAPWLRALVLGANDGLVSTAALMMGVGGGTANLATLRLAGVAGLVGGALSMAVGEYISVSSQRDAEKADIEKERLEQLKGPAAQVGGQWWAGRQVGRQPCGGRGCAARGLCDAAPAACLPAHPACALPCPAALPANLPQARELEELAQIYVARGLPYGLAKQVCRTRVPVGH